MARMASTTYFKTILLDQAWFWTERWQQMEREVDEDIRTDRSMNLRMWLI